MHSKDLAKGIPDIKEFVISPKVVCQANGKIIKKLLVFKNVIIDRPVIHTYTRRIQAIKYTPALASYLQEAPKVLMAIQTGAAT